MYQLILAWHGLARAMQLSDDSYNVRYATETWFWLECRCGLVARVLILEGARSRRKGAGSAAALFAIGLLALPVSGWNQSFVTQSQPTELSLSESCVTRTYDTLRAS